MCTFVLDGFDHKVGGTPCEECWDGWPRPCRCGGWIHTQFGDENTDGDFWLVKGCDHCGPEYDEPVD